MRLQFAALTPAQYSYTLELTNTNYSFILPASLIAQTATHAVPGILTLAEEVAAIH